MGTQGRVSSFFCSCFFIWSLMVVTNNFWTVAANTLKIGIATVRPGRNVSKDVLRSPVPVDDRLVNLSLTHIQIESSSALKTYYLLTAIDTYKYDLLFVEWASETSTVVTIYSPDFPQITNLFRQYNGLGSACQPPYLTDSDTKESLLVRSQLTPEHLQVIYAQRREVPYLSDLVNSIHAVVKEAGWLDMVLLYDNSYSQEARLLAERMEWKGLTVTNIEEANKMKPADYTDPDSGETRGQGVVHKDIANRVLEEMYFRLPRGRDLNVLLLCSFENVKVILTQADRFDTVHNKTSAMHMRSQWMVVEYGSIDVWKFLLTLKQLDNVAILYSAGHNNVQFSSVRRMQDILAQASSLFRNTTVGIRRLQINILRNFLQDCPVNTIHVCTLYYGKHGNRYFNSVVMVKNGVLTEKDIRRLIFPNKKFGLNNRTLILSGFQWPSFYIKTMEGNTTKFDGVIIKLFEHLQISLNFTVQYRSHDRNTLLYNGVTKDLLTSGVDLIVSVLPSIARSVDTLYDQTIGFHQEESAVVFHKPHPDEDKWLTLIKPFRWQVHMMLFVAVAVYGMLTAVMEKINPFNLSSRTALDSVIESVQYMFGALLNQGGSTLPSSVTGRVLVSFWWLFSIIIASTYGGNLIAFLTVSREVLPFNDVHGLVRQDKYYWGFMNGTIPVQAAESENVWKELYSKAVTWNKTTPGVLSVNIDSHLERVKTSDYAYIGPSSIIKAWVQNDCNLAHFEIEGLASTATMGLVKGSPYTDLFSDSLRYIQEIGLIDHWLSQRLLRTAAFCEGSLIAEAQAISLLDVQSVFYASVKGIVMAALLLAGEIGLARFRVWRQTRTPKGQPHTGAADVAPKTIRAEQEPRAPCCLCSPCSPCSACGWVCSTFNPCRRRSSVLSTSRPVTPIPRPASWPKADTRSVWNFNTSFRRSADEQAQHCRCQDEKGPTKERDHKDSAPSRHGISVIALSRRYLRPGALRRRNSFTDIRNSRQVGGIPDNRHHSRLCNQTSGANVIFSDGWFNPCFCDSDSSLDGIEDRQSDDGGASCDSGLDRNSVASTRFGDLDSELW